MPWTWPIPGFPASWCVVWSPCSTYAAFASQPRQNQSLAVTIVHVQQRALVSEVQLPCGPHYVNRPMPFMEWVEVGGTMAVAAWTRTHEDPEQATRVHFIVPGAAASWGSREVPLGKLWMGYGLAGFVNGSLILHHLQADNAEPGPAVTTAVQSRTSYMSVFRQLMAWAPQGAIWLAVVVVRLQEDGSQAAFLVLLDGRSGRVRSDTLLACNKSDIQPCKLIWSSSCLALMVAFRMPGCWRKVYVSFADR